MSSGSDVNINSNSHGKKKSKRQRQLLQKKLTKSQSTKVKRKRLPKKKKRSLEAEVTKNSSTSETANTKKSPCVVSSTPDKPCKRSSDNDSIINGKKSMPAKKKRKSTKPKAGTATTKTSKTAANKLSDTTVSNETDIEPDRNWKELAKKLGIKEKSRTTATMNVNKDTATVAEQSDNTDKWFDDVDEILIEKPQEPANEETKETDELANKLVTPGTKAVLTKCLAMDCEMVGVGPTGNESVLARISVVNQHGHCVYDKFVKAKEEVTDYRTWVSGVRPEDLENAEDLETVQKEVNEMFKGRILVGHAITNDEKVLFMNHPKKYVRDTQKYPGYRMLVGGRKPSLKILSQKVLGVSIQSGEHSSVQDAQATMRLYTMVREKWEKKIKEKYLLNKHIKKKLLNKEKKTSR